MMIARDTLVPSLLLAVALLPVHPPNTKYLPKVHAKVKSLASTIKSAMFYGPVSSSKPKVTRSKPT
jgi:hypothetical protein